MNEIKLILKQIILMIKYSISKLNNLLIYLGIILLAVFTTMFYIPLPIVYPIVLSVGIIFPSCLNYISTTYNIRKSTMYKNISLTKNNRYTFYVASFTYYLFISLIFFLITYSFLLIANHFDLIYDDWLSYDSSKIFYLLNVNFFALSYYMFEYCLVMFALMFMLQKFISSPKAMYVFACIFLILVIIYGGAFNAYFKNSASTPDGSKVFAWNNPRAFSNSLFYPQLILLPFFSPTQHISTMHFEIEYNEPVAHFIWQSKDMIIGDGQLNGWERALRWNIMWFMPYIHTATFLIIAIVKDKFYL